MYNSSQDVRSAGPSASVTRRVPVPQGFPAGAIFGKGGSNIQYLQRNTRARITCEGDPLVSVVLQGIQASVNAAEALLLMQFKHWQATGGAYPHPAKTVYFLIGFPGTSPSMEFLQDTGEVAQAADRKETLFKLSSRGTDTGGSMATGAPAGNGAPSSSFLASNSQKVFVSELTMAIRNAIAYHPRFDQLKLHSNFGKNYFYNDSSRMAKQNHSFFAWSLGHGLQCNFARLQGAQIPKSFKSVYSNGVSANTHVPALVARLQEEYGFERAGSKRVWSVDVVLLPENCQYSIHFTEDGNGGLQFKKIKSASCKLLFITSLGDADTADFRNKLLGNYTSVSVADDMRTRLMQIADTCFFDSDGELSVGDLYGNTRNIIRCKTKQAYKGVYHAADGTDAHMKVTEVVVCDVIEDDRRRQNTEITCRSDETKELLQGLLLSQTVDAPALAPVIRACKAVHEFGHVMMGY